jgi:hypothetical protein
MWSAGFTLHSETQSEGGGRGLSGGDHEHRVGDPARAGGEDPQPNAQKDVEIALLIDASWQG